MSFNVFLTGRLNINTFIGYKEGRETKCMLESTINVSVTLPINEICSRILKNQLK